MEYQVWTQDELENWKLEEIGDLETARAKMMEALKRGKEPILTQVIPYDVKINVKEDKRGEVKARKTEPGKGPGSESKS